MQLVNIGHIELASQVCRLQPGRQRAFADVLGGIDREEAETGFRHPVHVFGRLQVVGVRSPLAAVAMLCERGGGGLDDLLGCALRAFQFANGLLGENRGEIKFLRRGEVPRRGQPEAVAETKRFHKAKCRGGRYGPGGEWASRGRFSCCEASR